MTEKTTPDKKGKGSKKRPAGTEREQTNGLRKTSRKRQAKTANELMREAWEYIYANRHRRLDR
jgi:hypothetical protein